MFRWYHGILSKTEVENILRTRAEGSYLVRAKGGEGEYSLAIKSAKGFIHMRLSRGCGGGFRLGEEEREFNSVVEMVKHYSLNRLDIERNKLLGPNSNFIILGSLQPDFVVVEI